MRIVFVSNYYNHHQAAVSEELNILTGNNYYFIQTETFNNERKKFGWKNKIIPVYVLDSYASDDALENCNNIIKSA